MLAITRQGPTSSPSCFRAPTRSPSTTRVRPDSARRHGEHGLRGHHRELLFRFRVTEALYELRAMVILHEMAHMWFGDLVTMRWWDDLG